MKGQPQPVAKTVLYGLALFAFAAGVRYLSSLQPAQQNNPVNWPVFLGCAFVGAQLAAFLWPMLIQAASASHMIVSAKGINNNLQYGNRFEIRFWAWEKIGSVGAASQGGQDLLILWAPDGSEIERFGIKPNLSVDQIKKSVEHFGGRWKD